MRVAWSMLLSECEEKIDVANNEIVVSWWQYNIMITNRKMRKRCFVGKQNGQEENKMFAGFT